MKVACFSVAAVDYFPQLEKYFLGGNALNQSIRMSKLGVDCAFVGALGNGFYGGEILSFLKANGVDTSFVEMLEGDTASNRLFNDEFGERFGEENAWRGGVYGDYVIPEKTWEFMRTFDVWATHASCPNFDMARSKKRNNFLCVDYLDLPDFELIASTIDRVDIAYVGGTIDMIDGLFELSTRTKTLIVLTLGSKGSIAFFKGKQYEQNALPSTVVDTTGCGDAFQAGFTHCYFMTKDIAQSLQKAAELGYAATTHYGGVEW